MFVDAGYRTLLGTRFYDRVRELGRLGRLVSSLRTVVVYGPRNAGKSELARYFASRRLPEGLRGRVVLVDARRRLMEGLAGLGESPGLGELGRAAAEALGAPEPLVRLLELLGERLRPAALVIVDEFHLLHGEPRRALVDLEAAAALLAKRGEERTRLIVTVGEGFFATTAALSRLQGYSAGYLLVEHMPLDCFTALYNEYRERHGCRLGLAAYTRLAGTLPGYLTDLCSRDRELLMEWLAAEQARLDAAIKATALELGIEEAGARSTAAELLRGRPAATPLEKKLAEKLVEHNVAYPCPPLLHNHYRPQLPAYTRLLEAESPDAVIRELEASSEPAPPPTCSTHG